MKVFKTISILFITSIHNVLSSIYFNDYDFLVYGWINCFTCFDKSTVFIQAGIRHDRDIFNPHVVNCGGSFSVRGRALGYSIEHRLYFEYRVTCYMDNKQKSNRTIYGYIGEVPCKWSSDYYQYMCDLHVINVLK